MSSRFAIGTVCVLALLGLASLHADPPVAPAPREVRPDGASQDPAATITRIVKNSKAVGDRLAQTDPGLETQQTQAEILKDIDSLLKPPPGSRDNDTNKPENSAKKDKKSETDPSGAVNPMPKDGMGAKSDPEAKPGMNPMTGMEPIAGANPQSAPRRPRAGDQNQMAAKADKPDEGSDQKQPKDTGMNSMAKSGGMEPKKEPMPGGTTGTASMEKKDPDPTPMTPSGGVPSGPTGIGSAVPLDEDTAKKVWGGPRDQMRKQVDQYYNERFMPGYSTLLKGYYAHLAGNSVKK